MLLLKIRTLDNTIREFSLAWPSWANLSHYKITEILCTHWLVNRVAKSMFYCTGKIRFPIYGTVQLYCGWCSLCYHLPALLQAVHWRNWSKASGSFRGAPAFSWGFQTGPRHQGGGLPVAKHFNLPEHKQVHDMGRPRSQALSPLPPFQRPWDAEEREPGNEVGHASVRCKARKEERKNNSARKGYSFSSYTSPHGLAQKQGAAQYLSIALTPLYARAWTAMFVNFNVWFYQRHHLQLTKGFFPNSRFFLQ